MSLYKTYVLAPLARNFGARCREATKLFSERLDNPLPFTKKAKLWLHVSVCDVCERYGKQISFISELVSRFPEKMPTGEEAKLSEEARQRILDELKKNQPGS